MNMRALVALSMLAVSSVSAIAAEEKEWVLVTESQEARWEMKRASYEATKTKGGLPISIVIGRGVNKQTTEINLAKWYVSDADCDAQAGKLVTLGIDGKFKWEVEFVFHGGSVASRLAEMICAVRADYAAQLDKKGI